ncbi:MAG TPA: thioredoxin family protein [Patescibacteria group bacterium]|nr:thioredoxin family protein [Patescibacteria group bacterium]
MNNNIHIQVLGSGCAKCKSLYESTKEAVSELQINAEVEYITDVTKIIEMGILTSPAMVVNGKVVLTGGHDIKEIKEALNGHF